MKDRNDNDRLIRWAYLWTPLGIPGQTSLCKLFWRTVFVTPVKLLLVAVIGGLTGFGIIWGILWSFLIMGTVHHPFVASGLFLLGLGIGWAVYRRGDIALAYDGSLMDEFIRAKKNKLCPIIHIRHWEDS